MSRPALALLVLAPVIAACDPVHDDAVAALGPETPGVRQGPLHRPGQPCLLCHDGAIGDPQRFTVAGTVYQTTGSLAPSTGATVIVTDARGSTGRLSTNAAGNFYATPSQFDPTFPWRVSIEGPSTKTVTMQTEVEGNGTVEPNGSCASCHFDPAGPASPGHVALAQDDGGTPP